MTEFEKMFEQNKDFIFKYLLKLTRDPSLSEELTQETFFRAYMNYAGLKDKAKAPVWLCSIAKNTYFAWCNEQKKLSPLEEGEAVSGEDIEQALITRELAAQALKHLHELDEPYKEVFMLSVLGGFSLKDISLVFGKSESWARVTFYRARQKLNEKMKDEVT